MPRSLDRAEERKEVPAESYAVEVRFTFCNVFLNLSARKRFWAGTVTGIGSGSAVMPAVASGSGVWSSWELAWKLLEALLQNPENLNHPGGLEQEEEVVR